MNSYTNTYKSKMGMRFRAQHKNNCIPVEFWVNFSVMNIHRHCNLFNCVYKKIYMQLMAWSMAWNALHEYWVSLKYPCMNAETGSKFLIKFSFSNQMFRNQMAAPTSHHLGSFNCNELKIHGSLEWHLDIVSYVRSANFVRKINMAFSKLCKSVFAFVFFFFSSSFWSAQ